MIKLIGKLDAFGAAIALAIINCITILFSTFLFRKMALLRRKKIDWLSIIVIGVSVFALASALEINSGRPDILAQALFSIFLLCSVYIFQSRYFFIISGFFLGLIGATHPMMAIFLALILGILYSFQFKFLKSLVEILKTFILSIIIFCITVYIFSPFNPLEVIGGVLRHSIIQEPPRFEFLVILKRFLFTPGIPFFGFVLISFVFAYFKFFKDKFKEIKSKFLWILANLSLFFLFLYSIGSARVYNLQILTPIFFVYK